ncbi:hypothetical protein BU23DRAFT_261542 [Bimuria novae-zelandiae CBS 107.79]|uniref:Uncharacterized protein n=1 Tax=Bimuria novae-zelandiae CBS 107.79 TaxID=1447943 RepID=A0A6A5UV23_9PLEO|nr:hypothetical protein BU23DRAFT_261542 [Bimuria novae-zelandiae CBS 107.79]
MLYPPIRAREHPLTKSKKNAQDKMELANKILLSICESLPDHPNIRIELTISSMVFANIAEADFQKHSQRPTTLGSSVRYKDAEARSNAAREAESIAKKNVQDAIQSLEPQVPNLDLLDNKFFEVFKVFMEVARPVFTILNEEGFVTLLEQNLESRLNDGVARMTTLNRDNRNSGNVS